MTVVLDRGGRQRKKKTVTFSSFLKGEAPKGPPFKYLSLFSGAGIGDYGLTLAGGRCVGACEIDRHRRTVHAANLGAPLWTDIRVAAEAIVNSSHAEGVDLLFATPPCQGFSTANARRGNRADPSHASRDARNALFFEALKVSREVKPKAIVFENVPNFIERVVENPASKGDIGRVRDFIARELSDYVERTEVFCFSLLGVPQRRRRAVSILIRKDIAELNQSQLFTLEASNWIGRLSHVPRTVKSALRGMRALDGCQGAGRDSDPGDELHSVPTYTPTHYSWITGIPSGSGKSAWENGCSDCGYADTSWGDVFCANCNGILYNRPHVSREGKVLPIKGFKTSYRRMRDDELAPTVTTASGHFSSDIKLHFSENRVLSPRECAILQTVPHAFIWPEAQRFKRGYLIREMIGEAVPALVTYRLGLTLGKIIGTKARRGG